ncbi:MAG: Hydrogenase-4 component B [Synergistetes bacterium ADurb.BinA166]|nr:MAG: Hydrogenase-4 component B [Synergistetes bacterium ADurb.BinA166]
MPKSAGLFLIAAAAICGLPPLNGFLGEFLVFLGALRGVLSSDLSTGVMGATVIGGLGLISGLAVACFTRAFGLTFLGEPRSNEANHAHEAAWPMLLPMALLAAACLAVGLAGPWFLGSLLPETLRVTCPAAIGAAARLDDLFAPLQGVVTVVVLLLALIATLTLVRRVLLRGRPIGEAGTWDCGYLRPTARMEYTASSFAQPLAALFRTVLRTRRSATAITDEFPRGAKLETQTGDLFADRLIDPAFRRVREALSRLRWIQHGQVRLYVLYIALTLLALLIWKLT